MKTIYKYTLDLVDSQVIPMPIGARILNIQVQNGRICLWAIVEIGSRIERRTFVIQGTGNKLCKAVEDRGYYMGTVQNNGFVWHIFEIIEKGKPMPVSEIVR